MCLWLRSCLHLFPVIGWLLSMSTCPVLILAWLFIIPCCFSIYLNLILHLCVSQVSDSYSPFRFDQCSFSTHALHFDHAFSILPQTACHINELMSVSTLEAQLGEENIQQVPSNTWCSDLFFTGNGQVVWTSCEVNSFSFKPLNSSGDAVLSFM